MAARIISQKRFSKLVASTGPLSQPPGALTRISNLLFTTRGSLQIADGSQSIGTVDTVYTTIENIAASLNYTVGQYPYYTALAIDPAALDNVTGLSLAFISPGNIPAGSYHIGVVAIGSSGAIHTDLSASYGVISRAGSGYRNIAVGWNAVAGAVSYEVWYFSSPTATTGTLVATTSTPGTVLSSLSGTTGNLPWGNTSAQLQVFVGAPVSYGTVPVAFSAVTAGVFTSSIPQPATIAPGSPNFQLTAGAGYSPYGGISGVACNIPFSLQFAGKQILVLGNGLAPQVYDPSQGASATVTALANTFQAAYPTWQASVSWLTGAQISVLDGSTNYLFTASQGGVSGATAPSPWSFTQGTQTADGSVIWTSQGPIVVSVAPRGAAHAVAYAGSLWMANTSPTTTSDGIDGPTCLKMSDSNNPNSWNPVNTAFIGRDDGTQITGLQPFTIAALGISPTGSLCAFKEFTTYQVIGVFGSTSFEIQPAQTNLGCIAPRSIQFLPGFGVVRFTHLGFAVFDGINDRLISEDIRPYLFGGVNSESDLTPVDSSYLYLSQSAQTIDPPMYMCAMPLAGAGGGTGTGTLTRLFCYDLVMKAWSVLDLPWVINSLATIYVGDGYPLVIAGKSDGTVQRMQAGDLDWDTGAGDQSSVAWLFRSPDLFGEGSSQRIFFEQVSIKGYGSAAMVASILANLWLDGQQLGAQAIDVVPQGGSNLFEARVRIFRSGYRAHLDVSGNNGAAAGTIDSLDWAISPKSSLARRIIG